MSDATLEDRVEALLAQMSLDQKIGQMTQPERMHCTPEQARAHHIGSVLSGGGSVPGENTLHDWVAMNDAYWQASAGTQLGIPIVYGVDAIHGHNNVRGAVVFPHNIGLGAANDEALMERIGQVTAREILATGVEWTFAPTLAVVRNVRWGRTYESFSEDPQIVARLGAAMVRGLQGDLGEDGVIACAKHWVGDGGTLDGVDQGETRITEDELREVHIAAYLPALQAGVQTVMASYNSWNGDKCHGHRYLLTDVLKDELGFDGFVVSDWDGALQVDPDYDRAVQQSVNAGVDMFMVPDKWLTHMQTVRRLVEQGAIPQERIDDAVRRILRVKLRYGLMERARPAERTGSAHPSFGSAAHRAVAREAVRKSLVLLKHQGGVLPVRKHARILVAGKNADDRGHACGGFTIEWQGVHGNDDIVGGESVWEGIQACAPDAVLDAEGQAEGDFDVAIVVIGETPYAEGMGDIRGPGPVNLGSGARPPAVAPGSDPSLEAPADPGPGAGRLKPYSDTLVHARTHPEDLAVLERIAARGIPIVCVLVSGRPLVIEQELALSDALVAAWLPGSEAGGVADVLFGEHPFTGRLPFSWPAHADAGSTGCDDEESRFGLGYGLTV